MTERVAQISISYNLTNEEQRRLTLADTTQIPRRQQVQVEIPLIEALDRGIVRITENGEISPHTKAELKIPKVNVYTNTARPNRHMDGVTIEYRTTNEAPKIEEDSYSYYSALQEYDHILSPDEALAQWRSIPKRVSKAIEAEKANPGFQVSVAAWDAEQKEKQERKEAETALAFSLAERYCAQDPEVTFERSAHSTWGTLKCGDQKAGEHYLHGSSEKWSTQIDAEKDRRKEETRKAELSKMEAWVKEHGSSRLRKCLEARVLEDCRGIYRDERLAAERPGWIWQPKNSEIDTQIRNPSEAHLDAYLEARSKYGSSTQSVELVRVQCENESEFEDEEESPWLWALASEFENRTILFML